MDPYEVDPDMCEYQDIQRLKLQEAPENVPTGELPRHVMLSADRGLVGAVVPGTRVTVRAQPHCLHLHSFEARALTLRWWLVGQVSGVYSVTAPSGRSRGGGGEATMNLPYIRVVGINIEQEGRNRHNVEFSKVEEEEFTKMAKDSENDIYDNIVRSGATL